MVEFCMPSLGADMEAGTLREWMVKPGDRVKRGDTVALVDTQKGLIDIDVYDDGIVDRLLINVDEKVPVGTVLALIRKENEQIPDEYKVPVKEEVKPQMAEIAVTIQEQVQPAKPAHRLRASPLARKMAEEKGIDLNTLIGTGEEGAITKEDVLKAPSQKKESTAASPESIRMAVAAAMSRSNREIPHYYLNTRVDMSRSLAFLEEVNRQRPVKKRLLPVVLLIRSLAKALKDVPQLNAWWENGLQKKEEINIGFVISLREGGVVIPAINQADKKSLEEIMNWLNDIIPRARKLNFRSSELANSSITLTSLGDRGVETVYGVIYPPQVAVIGFGNIKEEAWAENGMVGARPVISLTLAADHRATDASTGSMLLKAIDKYLQNPNEP